MDRTDRVLDWLSFGSAAALLACMVQVGVASLLLAYLVVTVSPWSAYALVGLGGGMLTVAWHEGQQVWAERPWRLR